MSVTAQLGEASSPLRSFIERRLPNTPAAVSLLRQGLAGATTLAPPVDGILGRYPSSEVGIAVGIRLDLLFAPDPPSVASPPEMHPLTGQRWKAAVQLADEADRFIAERRPDSHPLAPDDEERLCRYCYTLGLFEQYRRVGCIPRLQLLQVPAEATVDDLLGIAPPACVRDIHELTEAARGPLAALRRDPIYTGPTFAGSADVGGGDADLIAGTCLVDFKTLKGGRIDKKMIEQLAAYVLLDYDDEYHLNEVALYMARQSRLLHLSVDAFFASLATSDVSVSVLRADLQAHLGIARGPDRPPRGRHSTSHARAGWRARERKQLSTDGDWGDCLECKARNGLFLLHATPDFPDIRWAIARCSTCGFAIRYNLLPPR